MVETKRFSTSSISNEIEIKFMEKMNALNVERRFIRSQHDKDHFDFYIFKKNDKEPLIAELKVLYSLSNSYDTAVVDYFKIQMMRAISGNNPFRIYFLYYDGCYLAEFPKVQVQSIEPLYVKKLEREQMLVKIALASMVACPTINFETLGLSHLIRV
jgi:hypothetical protein